MFPISAEYGTLGARMRGDLEDLGINLSNRGTPSRVLARKPEGAPPPCEVAYRQESEAQSKSIKKIDDLDLSMVKKKLCFPESRGGMGWTSAQADIIEVLYKDFLKECFKKAKVSPDTDVDDMWHTHILFTKEYHRDCNHVFGYYLHHVPNLSSGCGYRSDQDKCEPDNKGVPKATSDCKWGGPNCRCGGATCQGDS